MKKFLALMLAGVLCASAAYTALAVDEEEETPVVVSEEENATQDVEALLDALENDEEAQEIANEIDQAVKTGATSEDVNALLLALTDYINNNGYDVAQIKNGSKTKAFLGDFLEDCGVDSEALNEAIELFSEVNDDVFGSDDTTSADSGSDLSDGTSVDIGGSPEYYGVDSTTIPDTGYMN